jgi:uncharacterized protein GlcG (DUF336 family)
MRRLFRLVVSVTIFTASAALVGQEAARERAPHDAIAMLARPAVSSTEALTRADVEGLLARAAVAADAEGIKATIVVTDREANVLGAFAMSGASATTRIASRPGVTCGTAGLEGCDVPALFAAISKAGTASFFETTGNAFTPRTAGFIIQEHFPPTVEKQAGGPLFGVQFSSLPCTDITVPRGAASGFLPLGLSADPGGIPLYKNGQPVGGIGVEGDGAYTLDKTPLANDAAESAEERAAVAASKGFEAPAQIRATEILVNGIRLPFTNVAHPRDVPTPALSSLAGTVVVAAHDTGPSRFLAKPLGGVPGFVLTTDGTNPRFPFKASPRPGGLTADEVERVVRQAAQTSALTRAAIRQPLGSSARVSITVVDVDGSVLGFFRTDDAPIFGVDVSAQKARTAAFFSSSGAGAALSAAGLSSYVTAAQHDGVALDGSVAFSDRGGGFLSRPFFPDGIDGNANGPLSKPISEWSVFNDGLQLDLVKDELVRLVQVFQASGAVDNTRACTAVAAIPHGIQIFAGSVPLFKNGVFAGAIGVSGDGIDQDDFIATNGSSGFEAPPEKRCDRLVVRGARLPFVKFPRHPQL